MIESASHQLHERSALFLNLVGSTAQRVRGLFDEGLPDWLLSKVLANVVFDGHTLAHAASPPIELHGVGLLVWRPHKFGAVCQIRQRDDVLDLKQNDADCVDLRETFTAGEYRRYNFRDIQEDIGKDGRRIATRFLFPEAIPFSLRNELIRPGSISAAEIHYLERLAELYSHRDLTKEVLIGLASCRTTTAAYHSVLVCYLNWRERLHEALIRGHRFGFQNPKMRVLAEWAHRDIRDAENKIDYRSRINEYQARVRELGRGNELRDFVAPSDGPFVREVSEADFSVLCSLVSRARIANRVAGIVFQGAGVLGVASAKSTMNNLRDDLVRIDAETSGLLEAIMTEDWIGAATLFEKWLIDEASRQRSFVQYQNIREYYAWFFAHGYFLPTEKFKPGF